MNLPGRPAGPALPPETPVTDAQPPLESADRPVPDGPSDHDLVRRAQAGEEEAFADLVHRHEDRAMRVALSLVGNREDARDLAQEGFREGQVIPDMRLMDQYGDEVSAWQFYGMVIALDFSTEWCAPCQELAKEVAASVSVPIIGIGAGPDCDGQILVSHDMLGLYTRFHPRFVRRYAHLAEEMKGAFQRYVGDVRSNEFPTVDESY